MSNRKEAKLALLQRNYLTKLKAELPNVIASSKANSLHNNNGELKAYLHKIAGSGGSFGFSDVTRLAQAAESILIENEHKPEGASEQQLHYLYSLLDKLLTTVELLSVGDSQAIGGASQKSQKRHQRSKKQSSDDLCVWVLEPDEAYARALAEQLASFGFVVEQFNNCTALKQALASNTPDFLIADAMAEQNPDFYRCAEMAGINLAAFNLIIVSSVDDFAARIKAVRFGALTYLIKPFSVARLASLIREHQQSMNAAPERILLIDDDTALAELYKTQLEAEGMEVQHLSNPTGVLTAIQEYQPDLVLIDLYMPDYTGTEIAALIRQFDRFASLPIVYLSSETDIKRRNIALAKGADEFLTKPISDVALIAALRQRVKRARQLDGLIVKDSLTGLLKHSAIKGAVKNEAARAARTGDVFCVAMVDIDHFKSVNDTYGHGVGDTVIAALATLLTQRVRQTDHVGRYGGEEFMLVMPACDASAAMVILEDIRERFANIQFNTDDKEFRCTLSVGFIEVNTAMLGSAIDVLIEGADNALYRAKRAGRNRVVRAQ